MSTAAAAGKQRTFLGHPVGLYVLFFTEMWERFSYYGMRALLMLYMVNYFRWSQKEASTYYKIYTSFVYVTPILGGYLADRFLGNRRAVIIGAVLMAIGHFLMAFEEFPIFLSALLFLIMGNGMFKPNMSTQVGRLYAANDGRRDGAYTIFYMGINLGAFLSPIVCGWLRDNTVGGFHSGFTMAGIGMVLGLVIYLVGQPFIKELPPDSLVEKSPSSAGLTGSEIKAVEKALPLATHEGIPPDSQEGLEGTEIRAGKTPPLSTAAPGEALTEAQAEKTPSILGNLSGLVPTILYLIGGLILGTSLALLAIIILVNMGLANGLADLQKKVGGGDISNISNMILLGIAGFSLLLFGFVAKQVVGGMRDRVLAILVLGIFVVFFWAAFEQAGNVLNVWADQSTNRYLTEEMQRPKLFEEIKEDKDKQAEEEAPVRVSFWEHLKNLIPNMVTLKTQPGEDKPKTWGETLSSAFNPMTTEWFQSINALAIFLVAPLFAWMWVYLDRKGWQPSVPFKMVLGLVMMSASMAIMMGAARTENALTETTWSDELPKGIHTTPTGQLAHTEDGHEETFHAGRLTLDGKKLVMYGVLDKNECDRLIETSAPESFRKKVEELKKKSEEANFSEVPSVEVDLDGIPPGFAMKYSGLKKSVVEFKEKDGKGKLIARQKLVQKEVKGLLVAAGQPKFRAAVHDLYLKSSDFRVSSQWLLWSYILATLGELCLSPVGLSMVSKLAPTRFATMLMGVWLLTGAFGNFAAGAMGEVWGTIPPFDFFLFATVVVGASAVVLLVLVKVVTAAMHGVK